MNKIVKFSIIGFAIIIAALLAFLFFVVYTSQPGDSFFPAPPDLPSSEVEETTSSI